MKTATAVVLLLLAFTSKSYFFGVANAANSPVLDTDGDELRTGVRYYVVSSIWGAGGGGLALGRATGQSCPEIVVQRRSDLDNGTPVIFSNADSKDGVVRLSTDINIEFVPIRDRLCSTSTVWKLDNYDNSAGKWWVTTDGVRGQPGPNTLTSWFKIERAGVLGYKFRFCPSVCDSCKTLCSDIGRHSDDDGQIRLALSDNGWPWMFKKASKTIKQVVNAKH
uniref:Putative 21 kDa trypsin inhibitor n=1 Tax=Theobroma bicolor TaxID=108878 RepID=Q3BD85_9ROSI|nr:putative 21 kDa trypsin inhibitor [Theobroma bicolor]